MRTPKRSVALSAPRYVPMLRTPVSGSLVTQIVAVRYGQASKPGVEIGTGSAFSPPSGARSASPVITTSWQAPWFTVTGGIGFWIALSHAVPMSSSATPKPSA